MAKRKLVEVTAEEKSFRLWEEDMALEDIRELIIAHLESGMAKLKWIGIAKESRFYWVTPSRVEESWLTGQKLHPDTWYVAFERVSEFTGQDVWTIFDMMGEIALPAAPISDFEYATDEDFE